MAYNKYSLVHVTVDKKDYKMFKRYIDVVFEDARDKDDILVGNQSILIDTTYLFELNGGHCFYNQGTPMKKSIVNIMDKMNELYEQFKNDYFLIYI
ncbi:hypothetical protein [uncultured Arcobacter sp.]|uniref:hypothetical protein n=1 Tax=uncultured Arcobacter sp. TaxID=165434 RepID=UPI0026353822|nr:hypothetical protein [uncultured Arcobacter sp.]